MSLVGKRKRIGEMLCDLGIVSGEQVEEALRIQKETKERLGQILIKLGYVDNRGVIKMLGAQFGMDVVELGKAQLDGKVKEMVPGPIARKHKIVPVSFDPDENRITVAMSDPLNLLALDNLRLLLKCEVQGVLATEEEITTALETHFGTDEEKVEDMMKELSVDEETEGDVKLRKRGSDDDAGDDEEDEAPIIRLVTLIILEAFRKRASDIHLEPLENRFRVRYRIDGVLHEVSGPPKRLQGSVISRVKIMAGMDIAEKRLPQDGRIKITLQTKELDLRVSTLPATHGESVVMRILDKTSLMLGLGDLGFALDDQEVFEKLLDMPNGIILVTGPTGSGKTTSLYAALNTINRPNRKLITIEDPIEYQLTGINQVQIRASIGLTFASGLRSMLRQAPDVIMVGEIRDYETAAIAIQAALTGHLVFSTLHTNDAPSAITRLIDMGVKPYLVASAVQAVMAQRLVRILCQECRTEYEPNDSELAALGLTREKAGGIKFYRGAGCDACGNTGYKGRKGIFELMVVNERITELIYQRSTSNDIRKVAREGGMKTLREDGMRKVLSGITTVDEVMKITQSDVA